MGNEQSPWELLDESTLGFLIISTEQTIAAMEEKIKVDLYTLGLARAELGRRSLEKSTILEPVGVEEPEAAETDDSSTTGSERLGASELEQTLGLAAVLRTSNHSSESAPVQAPRELHELRPTTPIETALSSNDVDHNDTTVTEADSGADSQPTVAEVAPVVATEPATDHREDVPAISIDGVEVTTQPEAARAQDEVLPQRDGAGTPEQELEPQHTVQNIAADEIMIDGRRVRLRGGKHLDQRNFKREAIWKVFVDHPKDQLRRRDFGELASDNFERDISSLAQQVIAADGQSLIVVTTEGSRSKNYSLRPDLTILPASEVTHDQAAKQVKTNGHVSPPPTAKAPEAVTVSTLGKQPILSADSAQGKKPVPASERNRTSPITPRLEDSSISGMRRTLARVTNIDEVNAARQVVAKGQRLDTRTIVLQRNNTIVIDEGLTELTSYRLELFNYLIKHLGQPLNIVDLWRSGFQANPGYLPRAGDTPSTLVVTHFQDLVLPILQRFNKLYGSDFLSYDPQTGNNMKIQDHFLLEHGVRPRPESLIHTGRR